MDVSSIVETVEFYKDSKKFQGNDGRLASGGVF